MSDRNACSHFVYVDGFWMDATPVTNEKFEKFAKATGYLTIAERTPTKEDHLGFRCVQSATQRESGADKTKP